MHSLRRLQEKAQLKEEVKTLENQIRSAEDKIKSVIQGIRGKCVNSINERILKEFKEFFEEKELQCNIQDTQAEALNGIVKLSFGTPSQGALTSIKLTIDNNVYEMEVFLRISEFYPPSKPKTAFTSYDDREMITLREKKNRLEDKLQILEAKLKSLENLRDIPCGKLPLEYKIYDKRIPNRFSSFKNLLKALLKE